MAAKTVIVATRDLDACGGARTCQLMRSPTLRSAVGAQILTSLCQGP